MPEPKRPIVLGRFGKPIGLRGEVRFFASSDDPEGVVRYPTLWLGTTEDDQIENLAPISFERARFHAQKNQRGFLVSKIKNINSREKAEELRGRLVYVDENLFENLESGYYFHQLVGLQVYDQNKEKLGHVESVFDNANVSILLVRGDKEHMIPFIEGQFIQSVDLANQSIFVDWDLT